MVMKGALALLLIGGIPPAFAEDNPRPPSCNDLMKSAVTEYQASLRTDLSTDVRAAHASIATAALQLAHFACMGWTEKTTAQYPELPMWLILKPPPKDTK